MDEITVGSYFTGIAGLERGLAEAAREAGKELTILWMAENNEYCRSVLSREHPGAALHGSVTEINPGRLPEVRVFAAGFPCQDISTAGKRAGIEGSRSSLWEYCVEYLRVGRPGLALFENVAALTTRGLHEVLADLAAVGYDAEWYCFPASAVGAPHRRDRIIIIAYPDGERCDDGGDCRGERYVPLDEERDVAEGKPKGDGWQHRSRQDGAAEGLAYADDDGCLDGQAEEQSTEAREYAQREPLTSGADVSEQGKGQVRPCSDGAGWWASEPGLGRVAHDVPDRVHRIKALGNAVVPAWAEAVGRAVFKVFKEEEGR